jgi:hypothetical protein
MGRIRDLGCAPIAVLVSPDNPAWQIGELIECRNHGARLLGSARRQECDSSIARLLDRLQYRLHYGQPHAPDGEPMTFWEKINQYVASTFGLRFSRRRPIIDGPGHGGGS